MKLPIFDPTAIAPRSAAFDVLALSPMVMAMRAPQMMFEQVWPWYGSRKHEGEKAIYEKAAAVFESYGAVQAEIAQAYITMWFAAVGGKTPDAATIARAWQDICDASMQPSARRVRENYRRLLGKAA